MSKYMVFRILAFSVGRIARKLEIREPDSVDGNLICANSSWRFESFCSGDSHKVVLIDAITADAEAADEHTVFIEAGASWKKDDAALLVVRRAALESLRAGVLSIHGVEIEERAIAGAVDARRKQRHRAKAYGPVGYRSTYRHLI